MHTRSLHTSSELRGRPINITSAVLIGFDFSKVQLATLCSVGAMVLPAESVHSRWDFDQGAHLVGVSLRLPELERMRIERFIDKRGALLRALNEKDMVTMITERIRRR